MPIEESKIRKIVSILEENVIRGRGHGVVKKCSNWLRSIEIIPILFSNSTYRRHIPKHHSQRKMSEEKKETIPSPRYDNRVTVELF